MTTISIQIFTVTLISGLYTSLWGAFKDSPYEGFKKKTFPRSVYFHVVIFAIIMAWPLYREPFLRLNLFQIFFLIMGIERLATEVYKGFFRLEDQTKYFVPSRITFFGKVVKNEWLRRFLGVASFALAFWVLTFDFQVVSFWQFFLVAYLSGGMVSLGGAYKDAPFEGFHLLKFQRSSVVVAIASPVFYFLGPVSLGYLIFMNFGLERFLVEYYKTYIQRNMSGKFRPDLKKDEKIIQTREKFHYAALAIIALVVVLYVAEINAKI